MNKIANTVEESRVKELSILAYNAGPVSGDFRLDVRSVTEDCYIGFYLYLDGILEVNRVWLE